MISDAPSPGPDVLDGWKDIAEYLGKSVRTAQRWRQEFGLPVHRLGDREKEGVFAYRTELDEWRRTIGRRAYAKSDGQGADDASPSSATDRHGAPAPGPGAGQHRSPSRQWLVAGVVAVAIAIVLAAWYASQRAPSGPAVTGAGPTPDRQPARWLVIGTRFQAFNAAGEYLWQFESPVPLAADQYSGHTDPSDLPLPQLSAKVSTASQMPSVVMADADHDGAREVLFIARPEDPARVAILYCFDLRGGVRWRFSPSDPIAFGGEDFGIPPRIQWVTTSTDAHGTSSVWLSAEHFTWFPTWIYRLDASGRVQGRYGSNGRMHKLRFFSTAGRQFALLGGVNNERQTAAVAVLDVARFGGAAPAGSSEYRCGNCPPGGPEHYLMFPRTDLASLSPGMPHVVEFATHPSGEIVVSVQQYAAELPGEPGRAQAIVNYRLDSSFRVRDAEFSGEYVTVHNHFASVGRFDHRFDAPRETPQLWPVLRWNAGRYDRIDGLER